MKRDIIIIALMALMAGTTVLRSQSAATAKPPMEMLQDMKAANAALIDQQKKTLENLDEMEKAAAQIKNFSKRT